MTRLLPLLIVFAGCSDGPTHNSPPPGPPMPTRDLAVPAPAPDLLGPPATVDLTVPGGPADLTATGADLAAGPGAGDLSGGDYYLPAGYSLTPFLSTDPVREFKEAGMATKSGVDYMAVVETDVGRIVFDLLEKETPKTSNSFVWLALHHFYDGLLFHRVIDTFMAQTGCPNTLKPDEKQWGAGGPGYTFGLETVASLKFDGVGVVGMARSDDPNSNGSQFFITFGAASNLDGMYTVFGKVKEGMDVLPKIQRGEPPKSPSRMKRVYIVQK